MNKVLKYSLLIILVISLGFSAYLLFFLPDKVVEVDIDDPSTADNAPLGSVEQPKAIDSPSFMEDSEKQALNLDTSAKIQVLERADDGTILSYKVINSDEDIASSYYSPIDSQ